MAKSNSLYLHQLIQSMDRSEKRYFKVYLKQHPSKHQSEYAQLFDLVAVQPVYDEASITQAMGDVEGRFSMLKHRLYEKVLSALEEYEAKQQVKFRIRRQLNQAEVLLHRGMDEAAGKLLDRLDLQTDAPGLEQLALEVQWARMRSMRPDRTQRNDLSRWEGIETRAQQALEDSRTRWEAYSRRCEVFLLMQGQGTGMDIALRRMDTLKHRIQDGMDEHGHDLESKIWDAHSMAAIHYLKSDLDACLAKLSLALSHMEVLPEPDAEMRELWYRLQSNVVHIGGRLGIRARAEEALSAMKSKMLDQEMGADVLATYLQSALDFLNRYEHEQSRDALIGLEESFLESYEQMDGSIRSSIDISYAVMYLQAGERSKALKAVNRILFAPDISRGMEIYGKALMLASVLHLEGGDKEYMVHNLRNLKRYIRAHGSSGVIDQAYLEFAKAFRISKNRRQEYELLERFCFTLGNISPSDLHEENLICFDLHAWALRMLDGRKGLRQVA